MMTGLDPEIRFEICKQPVPYFRYFPKIPLAYSATIRHIVAIYKQVVIFRL